MCYVSNATDVPNLNFPRVVWTRLLWLCLTHPTLHVCSRCGGTGLVWPGTCVYLRVDASKTHIKTPFLFSVYSWEMLREDPQQQWPLIKGYSEHSFALTEVGRWSFDEHTLCTNSNCRTLSFQAFESLHLPVILSNNFSIFLSHSFSTSAKWSNIIFWIKTWLAPDTSRHCFPCPVVLLGFK